MRISLRHVTVLMLYGFVFSSAQAGVGPVCADLFAEAAAVPVPAPASAVKVVKGRTATLSKWTKLNVGGVLESVAREADVVALLNNKDLPLFGDRLDEVLDVMVAAGKAPSAESFLEALRASMKDEGFPKTLVEAGIRQLDSTKPETFYRLLGNLSFGETRRWYIGSEKGLRVTKSSLLGQYLERSGAKTRVTTLKNVVKNKLFTEERLVVSVSAASFPIWKELFSGPEMMSVFGHANVYTNGASFSHQGGKGELRALSPGTPLPLLLLKPSEGERLQRFMELSAKPKYTGWSHALKRPWELKGYAPRGTYSCCTHWIGNLPIGDTLVSEYAFPGGTKTLKSWKPSDAKDLVEVWKVPGNEQLSSVIGQLDRNVSGEFASPGYVIQTLFGPTTKERVPVVFLFAADHKAEIPAHPDLRFEQPR